LLKLWMLVVTFPFKVAYRIASAFAFFVTFPMRVIVELIFPGLISDLKAKRLSYTQKTKTKIQESVSFGKKLSLRIGIILVTIAVSFCCSLIVYGFFYYFVMPVAVQTSPINFALEKLKTDQGIS